MIKVQLKSFADYRLEVLKESQIKEVKPLYQFITYINGEIVYFKTKKEASKVTKNRISKIMINHKEVEDTNKQMIQLDALIYDEWLLKLKTLVPQFSPTRLQIKLLNDEIIFS
jgi:hypothetical protein